MDHQEESNRAKRFLLDHATPVLGAGAGALVETLVSSPGNVLGASISTAVASAMRTVLSDMYSRRLAPREAQRAALTAFYAIQHIVELEKLRAVVRNDNFLALDSRRGRSHAEEVFEGVLITARDAYEEMKLPLLGRLYANIAFQPHVTVATANVLVALVERLRYSQFVAMAVSLDSEHKHRLLSGDFLERSPNENGDIGMRLDTLAATDDIFDLYQRGLIHDQAHTAWKSASSVRPRDYLVSGVGELLADLTELERIHEIDRQFFYEALSSDLEFPSK